MVLSQTRTYKDILWVKEQISPHLEDKELHRVAETIRPFFASLDNQPVSQRNRQHILATYRATLAETIDYGIHCMADLTTFIEKEDAVYRAFLSRLPDFDGENLPTSRMTRNDAAHRYFLPPNGTTSPIAMP